MVSASVSVSSNTYSKMYGNTESKNNKSVSEMSFAANLANTSTEKNNTLDNFKVDEAKNVNSNAKSGNETVNDNVEYSEKDVHESGKTKNDTGIDKDADKAISDYDRAFSKIKDAAKKQSLDGEEVDVEVQSVLANIINIDCIDLNAAMEKLAEKLNISVDELSEHFEKLSLDISDLSDNKNAMKLVMAVMNIEDQAELLTNSELATEFKEILEEVNGIVNCIENGEFAVQDNEPAFIQNVDVQDDKKEFVETSDENEDTVKIVEVDVENVKEGLKNVFENQTNSGDLHHEKQDKAKDDAPIAMQFNNFDANNIAGDIARAVTEVTGDVKEAEVVTQIIEQIKVMTKQNSTSIEMQLYPEHLGKVAIQVTSKNGVITAEISAQTEAAKKAIESQLTILKDNFNNQGLKVDAVEVTIAGHGFEENLENNNRSNEEEAKKSRNSRRNIIDGIDNDEDAENFEEVKMETIGNTVSYMA